MSIAEASLYGDLVEFLRDRWAENAAEFNESTLIYQVFEHELRELQGLDQTLYEGVSQLTFWWD